MKVAAIVLTVLVGCAPVAIEVARFVVHARRERRIGLGGTQDIALAGALAGWGLVIAAEACWAVYFAK